MVLGVKDLLAVSEPVRVVGEGENLTPVSEPVKESCGEDGIAKEFGPAIEALVGGNNDGSIFVELGDELEEEVGFHPRDGKIPEFVNNEQVGLLDPLDTGLGVS